MNTTWEIVACFEGEGATQDVRSFHLNLVSFFVLPESALGTIVLITASLGVLGGYVFLKKSNLRVP